METISHERFSHGSIGLYHDGYLFYVSLCYYRQRKHDFSLKTDCCTYADYNTALTAYNVKRECMGYFVKRFK